jgi:hypothetical protein
LFYSASGFIGLFYRIFNLKELPGNLVRNLMYMFDYRVPLGLP